METGFLHIHSFLRWAILILLIATIFNSYKKWRNKGEFGHRDNQLSLYTFIAAHLQLVIGFVLYGFFMSRIQDHSTIMSNHVLRFFGVEHLVGMLIAIILITIGRIKAKKLEDDVVKHKTTFVYYIIALVIILASIPWPFRGFGTGWL